MAQLHIFLFIAVLYPVSGAAASLPTALQPLQPNLPASLPPASLANNRQLSAIAQPAFHVSYLHDALLLNGSTAASVTGSLRGAKAGAPATCYGQPCSPSACYPSAVVTARHHVNYVNVTAAVQLSRAYNVSSMNPQHASRCTSCCIMNSIGAPVLSAHKYLPIKGLYSTEV